MFAILTNSEVPTFSKTSVANTKFVDVLSGFTLLTCGLLITSNVSYAQEPENNRNLVVQADTSSKGTQQDKDNGISASSKAPKDSIVSKEQAWEAFVPPPDNYDWIQLTSGEWLKGQLKVLYNKDVEFDSDELDLLKLDLEDVKRIRGHGIKGIRLEGPTKTVYGRFKRPEAITVYGTLELTEDKVIVTSGQSSQEFDRSRLIAIVSGEDRELDFWSAKISLGLNLSGGNTEQVEYSSIMNIRRRTAATRFVIDFLGNYSRTRGIDTVDNNRLNAYLDVFRTRDLYWRAIFGEYFRDPFQNIEYRYTIGSGVGYHIIDTPNTEWDITIGLAYQETQFNSVEAGEDPVASTPAFTAGTKYDTELTKKIDFIISYSFNIVNQESGSYNHHSVTAIETELTKWLDFDISFVWDRIKEPTANADGTIPKPDDYKLIFSLGVDY
jgi:hypothetical protein